MDVKIKEYPYRYKAFSLNVFSEIPVSGLPSINNAEADVFIERGVVPAQLPDPLNKGVLFQATGNEFLLHVTDLASFLVQNGKKITIEYRNDHADNEIYPFLLGTVFGALLHQRNMLPLHGSSVFYRNKTLTFSGISGAGKSTLAAAFIEKGARLIADDISLIDFSEGTCSVVPAFPGVKIWEDSLKKLGKEPAHYQPLRNEMRKYLMPVNNYYDQKAPAGMIFVLNTHNRDDFEWKTIYGIEKFNYLKNNTYLFRGLNKTGILRNHFEMCNKLAKETVVTLITRPGTGFKVDELVSLIESICCGN